MRNIKRVTYTKEVNDMDEALLLGEEYKKNFDYEKKVFHSLARLYRNLGNLKKSYEHYEILIEKNDAPKKAWCSFLMTLNYENYISDEKHFEYSKEFVKKINLKYVVLCSNLSISGINTAGIPDNIMRTLILDLNFDKKYFERMIHHEIFHIINDHHKKKLHTNKSKKINNHF